jgi:predicted nucleotidyltransferase
MVISKNIWLVWRAAFRGRFDAARRELAMRRDDVLRILAEHRTELARFGAGSIALFGSVARGEARPESDVDLLVDFNQPVGLFELVELKDYLEELLGCSVDLVPRDSLKRQLRDHILKEAIPAA